MRGQDTYKETITIELPNMIATVHFPDLSEDEHKKRMMAIYKASANILEKVRKGV